MYKNIDTFALQQSERSNRIMNSLEICFSPALLGTYDLNGKIVVLVDILRATSTICTALHKGVREIIPVESIEEAKLYKEKGYLVAGERDGKILDFADFGNSPFNFMDGQAVGKPLVYSTTNGTRAIRSASGCAQLLIGSYLNHTVLCNFLADSGHDIVVFCSGWKDKFNLEDSLYAGALCTALIDTGKYETVCDSVHAATDLWQIAGPDVLQYIQKAAHRRRLKNMKLDDVLEYCHSFDLAPVIPVLTGKSIVTLTM
jgi:2-phosphosulfolactate phosphatase